MIQKYKFTLFVLLFSLQAFAQSSGSVPPVVILSVAQRVHYELAEKGLVTFYQERLKTCSKDDRSTSLDFIEVTNALQWRSMKGKKFDPLCEQKDPVLKCIMGSQKLVDHMKVVSEEQFVQYLVHVRLLPLEVARSAVNFYRDLLRSHSK